MVEKVIPNEVCLRHAELLSRIEERTAKLVSSVDTLKSDIRLGYVPLNRYVIVERIVFTIVGMVGLAFMGGVVRLVMALN